MDSLPQEIIDQIIDNLPPHSLRSPSLIAKRWRKRSQQRAFSTIRFRSEFMVNRWHAEIQSSPSGISSYTRFVGFGGITKWRDSGLFGRAFRNFNSLTTLGIYDTEISDKMLKDISRQELGRITNLHLQGLGCSPSTVMAMILAFPNLRDLVVIDLAIRPEEPSTHTTPLRRRPLDSLLVCGFGNGPIAEALADYRFASSRLILEAQPRNIQKLLAFSSATVVELVLEGVCPSCGRPRVCK